MAKGATVTGNSWVKSAELFADLCDDQQRAIRLRGLIAKGQPEEIASRASTTYTPQGNGPDDYEQTAWLITDRDQAKAALRCDESPKGTPRYSNWSMSTILTARRQLSWPVEAGNEFDCLGGCASLSHRRGMPRLCGAPTVALHIHLQNC